MPTKWQRQQQKKQQITPAPELVPEVAPPVWRKKRWHPEPAKVEAPAVPEFNQQAIDIQQNPDPPRRVPRMPIPDYYKMPKS